MENRKGLDMRETLDWYLQQGISLPKITNAPIHVPYNGLENVDLKPEEIGGLVKLVTQNALNRSTLKEISGQGPLYFSEASTTESPKPTPNPSDAISPTAIIPSFIQYGKGESKIFLYALPNHIPENVRRIVCAEGFMHELGHSIGQNALYGDQELISSNNKIISGFDAMMEFAKLAEKHEPISHYASTFRGPNGTFDSNNPNYNPLLAISEEFAETFAAHHLGFAYRENNAKKSEPLSDRPEIRDWMESFLDAKEK